MGTLRQFFRYWFVDRHQRYSIDKERRAFVQAALSGRDVGPVYLLAVGVTKPELEEFIRLAPDEAERIHPRASLAAYGVVDADGHKHFFYENWSADYSCERSWLHAVRQWPDFTKHFIEGRH